MKILSIIVILSICLSTFADTYIQLPLECTKLDAIQSYHVSDKGFSNGVIIADDTGDNDNNLYSGIVVKMIGDQIQAELVTQMSGTVTLSCVQTDYR